MSSGRKEGELPRNAQSFLAPVVSLQCAGIFFPHFSLARAQQQIPEEGEETLETPKEEKKEPQVPELPREEEAGQEAVLSQQGYRNGGHPVGPGHTSGLHKTPKQRILEGGEESWACGDSATAATEALRRQQSKGSGLLAVS